METVYGKGGKTLTDVEEFLMSALDARREAERLSRRVAELESRARRMTVSQSARPVGGPGPEEVWMRLAEEREQLLRQRTLALERERAVDAFIARLRKPRWRAMLRLCFLDGCSLREASSRLNYSYGYGRRLSGEARRAAASLWETEAEE